ncbi:MAG: cysteine hydrolase, partial [Faecalibacterium sp.]|nr:cysteine hydrolase [Faecalibacterium sp.]
MNQSKKLKKERLFMVLLVVDAQNGIVDERLYEFR